MAAATPHKSPGPRPVHAPNGPVVMVAEDDRSTLRLITFTLERAGCRVAACSHGEELLEFAKQSRPGLIILDLMMPVQDGFTTLRALNSNPDLQAVPVLVLTSKNHREDMARCLGAGAADYMVKPFSPGELVRRVRQLLPHAPKS